MTAKMDGARVEAFLAALAETGNASLAAKQAGLSRSWVTKARQVDPELDARVRAARGEARARLGGLDGNRPPEAWRMRRGVELVVTRRGQIARAPGVRRWTQRKEERFLVELRKTRNFELAAPAVGMSIASLERHRRRWPAFERRVQAALRLSAGPLALTLIEREIGGGLDEARLLLPPRPGLSVAELIRTLRRNKWLLDEMWRTRGEGTAI